VTPEALATQEVRLAASQLRARIFRNNAGACVDSSGRQINYGLGNDGTKASKMLKFGDYIGYQSITITPEMVGKTVAVFVNLEIKPDGKLNQTLQAASYIGSRENLQLETCNLVKNAGGFAGIVTNKQDVEQVLNVENIIG
jgi:hypothetical protein